MNKIYFLLVFLISTGVNAQEAINDELIKMGIKYHDRGEYNEAVKYYDMVLTKEPNNELALVEKSFSLNEAKNYTDAATTCNKIIELKPQNKNILLMAYLHCGSAYDGLKNEKKSIEMYNEAAKIEPKDNSIFFNKGITYMNYSKSKEAEKAFKQSLILKPNHPSSLYQLSYIAFDNGEKIPAILGFCKFLIVEPTSKRSIEVAKQLLALLDSGIEKTGKEMTLKIVAPQKEQEDFTVLDLALGISNSMTQSEELKMLDQFKESSKIALLKKQLEIISTSLKSEKKEKKIFYRPYFTDYFSKMGTKEIEVLANTILAANNDEASITWIRVHDKEVNEFYNFSNNNF